MLGVYKSRHTGLAKFFIEADLLGNPLVAVIKFPLVAALLLKREFVR